MIDFNALRKSTISVRLKNDRVQALKDMRESITGIIKDDKVQTSLQGDKLARLTAEILDLEDEIKKDVESLKDDIRKADLFLFENLEFKDYEVMYFLLILGLSRGDAALKCGVSRQTVYNIESRFNEKFTKD